VATTTRLKTLGTLLSYPVVAAEPGMLLAHTVPAPTGLRHTARGGSHHRAVKKKRL